MRMELAHAMTDRRFPPPWTVEDNGAAFIVKDPERLRGGNSLRSTFEKVSVFLKAS